MAARIGEAALVAGLLALAALASPSWAQAPASPSDPPLLTDAAFDASFLCPETLASDAARRQAMVDYFHWAQAAHPDWSVADAVEFKKTLLVRHQYEASLRDLAAFTKREQIKPR